MFRRKCKGIIFVAVNVGLSPLIVGNPNVEREALLVNSAGTRYRNRAERRVRLRIAVAYGVFNRGKRVGLCNGGRYS